MLLELGPPNNSPEWFAARLGKVTGGNFHRFMAKGNDWQPGAYTYALEVAHEIITGQQKVSFDNEDMAWGRQHEPAAIELYQERTFNTVQPGRFVQKPGTIIGGSPDGFVGDDGIIEVKCPASGTRHLATVLDGTMPMGHTWQVQGYLWLTGRNWCDFISYDPRYTDHNPIFIKRVFRNDKDISNLMFKSVRFVELVKDFVARSKSQ